MDDIKIWKENGWYIAHIPALGVVDQAKTLKGLKKELNEAIELSLESIIIDDLKFTGSRVNKLRSLLASAVINKIDGIISKKEGKTIMAKA
ncbi:MAG: type II toxin-antitoxin system HicB family antitoxin [Candidatus Micrarchaeota archaeon]|nr:type II toxin-antitoxin system HicB family antitoxin [Candidatus Micrarchaeota archaeon]